MSKEKPFGHWSIFRNREKNTAHYYKQGRYQVIFYRPKRGKNGREITTKLKSPKYTSRKFDYVLPLDLEAILSFEAERQLVSDPKHVSGKV